jgi:drug/metabolite transporter (DMT)-like permease
LTKPSDKPRTDNKKASLLFLIGLVISTAMVWMIKTLGQNYGPFQIVLARNVVTAACLLPFFAFRFLKSGWLTNFAARLNPNASPWKLVIRSLLAFGGQAFGISAIAALPLAQSQALSFTKGFIVLALAVMVLREDVGVRRWMAMGLGFIGVLVAVRPGTEFDPAAFYAIASATCFAFATIVMKQLTAQTDNLTLMTWGSLAQAGLALPFAIIWWAPPTPSDWLIMLCLGLVAILIQNIMLSAYRLGDVSVLSPLDYLRVVTGSILGFLAFGEVPTLATIIGAILIIVANVVASHQSALVASKASPTPNKFPAN